MMRCGGRHYKATFGPWKSQQRLGVLQGERGPQAPIGGGRWEGRHGDLGIWGFGDGTGHGTLQLEMKGPVSAGAGAGAFRFFFFFFPFLFFYRFRGIGLFANIMIG